MGAHKWIERNGKEVCKLCGVVRSKDMKNKACKPAKVEVRENPYIFYDTYFDYD